MTLDFTNSRRPNFQPHLKNEPPHANTSTNQFGQPLIDTRELPAFQARQQNVRADINTDRQPSNTIPQPESTVEGFQFNTLPIWEMGLIIYNCTGIPMRYTVLQLWAIHK